MCYYIMLVYDYIICNFTSTYICANLHIYMCVYVCVHMCMYVYVCMFVNMCVCVYIYVCELSQIRFISYSTARVSISRIWAWWLCCVRSRAFRAQTTRASPSCIINGYGHASMIFTSQTGQPTVVDARLCHYVVFPICPVIK